MGPAAPGAPASTYLREQLRLPPPDLIADRLRCNPGHLEPSVSYTPTPSFFCASSCRPWRTLGSRTQHAGAPPPRTPCATMASPAQPCTDPAWVCLWLCARPQTLHNSDPSPTQRARAHAGRRRRRDPPHRRARHPELQSLVLSTQVDHAWLKEPPRPKHRSV